MTLVYASGSGPVLVYNGQEVGERAEGPGGFGGHDGRTSIFDYTCLPRLQPWVANGRFGLSLLPEESAELRNFSSEASSDAASGAGPGRFLRPELG